MTPVSKDMTPVAKEGPFRLSPVAAFPQPLGERNEVRTLLDGAGSPGAGTGIDRRESTRGLRDHLQREQELHGRGKYQRRIRTRRPVLQQDAERNLRVFGRHVWRPDRR